MMTKYLMVLVFLALPCTACADCVLTESLDTFKVVCSEKDSTSPSADSKSKSKTVQRSSKAKKVNFEVQDGVAKPFVMSEEEMRMMQTNNSRDGYRAKQKHKEQHAK